MSLNREEREKILRIVDFLNQELNDLRKKFLNVSKTDYFKDRDLRRNLERCIENIVNASIDIAKILVINIDKPVPDTYREYFYSLLPEINDETLIESLAEGVSLRNILAHQYLDIRWPKVKRFLRESEIYKNFLDRLENIVK